jgi:hypothetical protein
MIPLPLGDVIKQAHQARRSTRRHLADQLIRGDCTPISSQYLFDIEVHHRVPTPYVLCALAQVPELDYNMPTRRCRHTAVREYLHTHPEAEVAVIRLFRAAQQRQFHDWDQLLQHIKAGSTDGS